METTPIIFGNFTMNMRQKDIYLGQILHEDGLEASVSATVKEKAGKFKGAIFDIRSIIEEFSIQTIGGIYRTSKKTFIITNSGTKGRIFSRRPVYIFQYSRSDKSQNLATTLPFEGGSHSVCLDQCMSYLFSICFFYISSLTAVSIFLLIIFLILYIL